MSNYCIKKEPLRFEMKPRSEININKTKERWSNSSILYRGWIEGEGRGGGSDATRQQDEILRGVISTKEAAQYTSCYYRFAWPAEGEKDIRGSTVFIRGSRSFSPKQLHSKRTFPHRIWKFRSEVEDGDTEYKKDGHRSDIQGQISGAALWHGRKRIWMYAGCRGGKAP